MKSSVIITFEKDTQELHLQYKDYTLTLPKMQKGKHIKTNGDTYSISLTELAEIKIAKLFIDKVLNDGIVNF